MAFWRHFLQLFLSHEKSLVIPRTLEDSFHVCEVAEGCVVQKWLSLSVTQSGRRLKVGKAWSTHTINGGTTGVIYASFDSRAHTLSLIQHQLESEATLSATVRQWFSLRNTWKNNVRTYRTSVVSLYHITSCARITIPELLMQFLSAICFGDFFCSSCVMSLHDRCCINAGAHSLAQ